MYGPCHLAESNKEHYMPSFEALDKLASHISGIEFSSSSFGDVEAVLQEKGQEIIRQLAQGYLSQRSAEEEKKEFVVGEDGIRRSSRRKGCTRKIESRFGEVELSRIGYYGQFVGSVFPLDAELNLCTSVKVMRSVPLPMRLASSRPVIARLFSPSRRCASSTRA